MKIPDNVVLFGETTAATVRDAAAICKRAEVLLKALFPDLFSDGKGEEDSQSVDTSELPALRGGGLYLLEPRTEGNLSGESFYLGHSFKWYFMKDSEDNIVLVPRQLR